MQVLRLEILANQQVSQRYWHMVVDSRPLKETVRPGQFFNFKCSDGLYPFLRRPFSIYQIHEDTLEFLYRVKGLGTQSLTLLRPGDHLDVFGPLGVPFTLDPAWDRILLLARGVGIATLTALAQEAAKRGVQTVAVLSARSRNDLLAVEVLRRFGAEVHGVSDEEGTSGVEKVRERLQSIFREQAIKAAFTCGSRRLSRLLKEMVAEAGIPAQIALEEHMGCAMGVCFACVCHLRRGDRLQSARVCCDGPVFNLEEVVL